MELSRQQYLASLDQLEKAMEEAKQQLSLMKLQHEVSRLFLELNDSPGKTRDIPHGIFADNVVKCNAYFQCEDGGEMEITVHRTGDHYWENSPEEAFSHFIEGELEKICKDAEWSEGCCKVKVKTCKVSPAWNFIDSSVVTVPTISITDATPEEASIVSQSEEKEESKGETTITSV